MSRKTCVEPRSRLIAQLVTAFVVAILALFAACGGDDNRKHKNPVPVLTSVSPSSATAGGAAFALTVNGSNFVAGSTVYWNGTGRATQYAGSTQLTAAVLAGDLASVGTAQVTVVNPAPGGGTSAAVSFTIVNAVPVATSLSPSSMTAGSAGLDLTVNGSGFVPGATVQWSGAARPTTFVSGSAVRAAIPAADLSSAGIAQVTVINPPPGGGSSAALSFTIENAVPAASELSPSVAVVGRGAFDLTVKGTGFVKGATVQWNGSARPTTFVDGNTVKAAIPAADLAAAGIVLVRVVNPTPGGGASAALTFTVQNPRPVVTSLNPSSVQAGSAGFDLSILGAEFVRGATVRWRGASRSATFVSPSQLVLPVSADDVAVGGFIDLVVQNPEPSVGPSTSIRFVIVGSVIPPEGYPVRVTVAPDGSPPNGPSVNGGMDWEARLVVFASKASNLVEGDTNEAYDLFVRYTCLDVQGDCTPLTRRLVMAADGSQPNGDSGCTATSPDDSLAVSFNGRLVAFVSSASNLVAGDTNGVDDVYLKGVCTVGTTDCGLATVRVSVRADGSESSMPASDPAVADDGRYVFFVSGDPNMVPGDGNGMADVFMRDTCVGAAGACTPSTTRISVAAQGGDANGASGEPVFTGRYVAFSSEASNLVAGDTNGVADVFLRDTCIGASGSCMPSTERISVGSAGQQADGASSDPQVGPPMVAWGGYDMHGRLVAFVSVATNLVAGDTNGFADVFERDTCRGTPGCAPTTVRVSVTSTGGQIAGASGSPGFLRWDGETIPFVTAANGVVPQDTNGLMDVYVRHLCPAGAPDYCRPSVTLESLAGDGTLSNGASFAPRLSHDPWGAWAVTYFSEATNLVPEGVAVPHYGGIYLTWR
jgi:hypothetical protein